MRKQGRSLSLITRSKHQLFELGVAAQRVEIDITLSANSELRLEVKRAPKRLQRRIDRSQAGSGRSQPVMNVRGFRLPLERALEKFLRRNVLAAIQFNDATIVKRVGVTRRRHLSSQSRVRYREVGAGASRDFGNRGELFYQRAE